MSPRVLVVGGGVTGLAAAHRLRTTLGGDAEVTVVESARLLGGKLHATELGGRRVDVGAEAFLTRRPEAADRIAELGLAGQLVHPSSASALLRAGGASRPMPARTVMGVPADPDAVAQLLSPAGRATLEAEGSLPPVDWAPGSSDTSVGALVRSRVGDEVADRLVDPLLGGVYSGRADGLGLRATVPALAAALDADPRSLTAAARAALPARPPEGTAPAPVFGTLRGGLADLPAALAVASRASLVLGRTVTRLRRAPGGWVATVAAADGTVTELEADAVVLAVPPPALRRLLADLAPHAAAAAAGIELASSAVVALALPARARPGLGDHSGVLVGVGERRPDGLPWTIKAATYSSVKWPHLAAPTEPTDAAPATTAGPPGTDDDGTLVLRLSIGRGAGDDGVSGDPVLRRDDDDLLAAARDDLAALTGVTDEPIESAVVRWGGGLPQYGVGHLDRAAALETGVAELPGLAVAGAALHGVGVPACLATADAAAARVGEHLRGLVRGGNMAPWHASTTPS